jgi:hypothetical protein
VNEGIRVSDSRSQSPPSASSKLRVEDLQTLNTAQLYALVRSNDKLSLEELRTIYDVIADRLKQSKHPVSEGARASLRESIQARRAIPAGGRARALKLEKRKLADQLENRLRACMCVVTKK